MGHWRWMLLAGALCAGSGAAADRSIVLKEAAASSWDFPSPPSTPPQRPQMAVGFWQRGSGAKPGVGSNYVSAMEFQLPETPPLRVRSASFQFSGRPWQCVGGEMVVVDLYAYLADGRADVADTAAGSRIAQLRADCQTNPAFAQPIDVSALVRQWSVPAGVRHIGFNVRKANHRQGPGLFALVPGTLTIVLADEDVAAVPPMATVPAAVAGPPAEGAGPNGLLKAFGTLLRGAGSKAAQQQAAAEALSGVAELAAEKPPAAQKPAAPGLDSPN